MEHLTKRELREMLNQRTIELDTAHDEIDTLKSLVASLETSQGIEAVRAQVAADVAAAEKQRRELRDQMNAEKSELQDKLTAAEARMLAAGVSRADIEKVKG